MPDIVRVIAVSGYGANHLELVPLDNTPPNVVAGTEDPLYPATNQINRNAIKPYLPWRALDITSDQELVFDKSQVFNGDFEAGTLGDAFAEGWETQGVEITDSPVNTGTLALQFGASELEPFALQTLAGRAGETIAVEVALRALTAGEGNVTIFIEQLGLYLDTDGATWTTTPSIWFTRTNTGSYLLKHSDPVLPAYTQLVPDGIYNVTMLVDGEEFVADSAALWHWTDTAAIIGHNVHPVVTAAKVRASDDNFASDDQLVHEWTSPDPDDPEPLTDLRWPNAYAQFTLRGERWWKFVYDGSNDQPIWNGQCVLSQELELERNPNYGILTETVLYQKRNETDAGASWVHPGEDIQRRRFVFPWSYHDKPQWQQVLERIFWASKFGQCPTLLIHDDTDPESCAFVQPPDRFDVTHSSFNVRDADSFPLVELAFPTFLD